MKLISEENANNAMLKIDLVEGGLISNRSFFNKGFDSGVDFAETALQNLAVEFAEWKDPHYLSVNMDIDPHYILISDINVKYTARQLFQKFMKQRKK